MKVRINIIQLGNNTGIEVPHDVPTQLGGGKTPLVTVTLNGFTYPSKIARMGGRLLIPVSAEVRAKAGVRGGESHEIELVLDDKPRVIDPPDDLAAALAASPAGKAAWDALSPSRKKAHVTVVGDAKTAETRARRIENIIAELAGT